jgi:type VI secretion system protein ImpH
MGAEGRMETADLGKEVADRLAADPTSFGFFQAIRLLERANPEKAPVGEYADPADEVVRFSVPPSLAFPASEIQSLESQADGPARMAVNFFGLTGPQGVLPYHYTQLVADRLREKDPTMRDFFDLFHHRMISLFYRAWEKYRFPVSFERNQQDRLTRHIGELIGLGFDRPDEQRWVRRETLLYYAGLVASRQRSALALQEMLEDYFKVPVEVQQFIGAWYPLGEEVQCFLDDTPPVGVAGLGEGTPIGDEMWDQQARVRLRVGPLTRPQYEDFLPRGKAYKALREMTHFFGGDGFDFELQLVLARDEVPRTELGSEPGEGLPLAWGTWLRTGPLDRDPDDTILAL